MLTSLGLWRAATRRSRAEWPVSLAAFLLLLCGTTLLAAGTLYADTVSTGGLRRSIADAPIAGRTIVIRASTSPDRAAEADPPIRAALEGALGPAAGGIDRVTRVVSFAPGAGPDDPVRQLVAIAAAEGIDRHATVVDGRWPAAGAATIETALPAGVAQRLGLSVGDRLTLPGVRAGSPLDLQVVGTWRPTDRNDGYWLGDELDLDGVVESSTQVTIGPAIVAPEDLTDRVAGGSLDVQWRAVVDPERIAGDDLAGLRASLAGLQDRLHAGLVSGPTVNVTTDLPAVLEAVERSVLVSRSGILLLTIQFAVLAGYAVLLVAGMLAERRRAEVALLRSRGAGTGHIATITFLEGLLLAVPAVLLAPPLAVGIVRLLGSLGPLAPLRMTDAVTITPGVVVVSLIAAAVYLVALTVPSIASMPALAGVRAALGRQVGRTLPQRMGIDLALIALALIAMWQLRLYGAPLTRTARGTLGIDPLLVAAPAIGLLAGVLLAARLVPRLAEIGERLVARRRSLVGPLTTQQLARRPLRYTRSAMLLMLASALGTFALAQAATWSRSQTDQATYSAATGVRLVVGGVPTVPDWSMGSAVASIDGVAAAMPVSHRTLDIGRALRGAQLVGLDPAVAASIVGFRDEEAARLPGLLRELPAARPTAPVASIDGDPARIALTVDARLAAVPDIYGRPAVDPDAIAAWEGVIPTLVVADGAGQTHRIELSRGRLGGGVQRLEAPLTATIDGRSARLTRPFQVVGVEVRLAAPPGEPSVGGTVSVGDLAVEDGSGGWRSVGSRPADGGWAWDWTSLDRADVAYRPPDGQPGTIVLGDGAEVAPPISGAFVGDPGTTFRIRAMPSTSAPLRAIASTAFLTATGAQVGDRMAGQSEGQDLAFEIVGSTDTFPSLDPAQPFLIVDGPSLELARYAGIGAVSPADQWWIATAPGRSGDVARDVAALAGTSGQVIEREAVREQLISDPVALGVIGALGLGALAALAFAAIGFIVGATISASERLGEFALLRALGLSSGGLSAWLTLENAFLLTTGIVTGVLLGAVLAWVVLPVSTLTAAGQTPVPAPVVEIPWGAILPMVLVAVVLLAVAVLLAIRQLPGARVSGVLRAWEG